LGENINTIKKKRQVSREVCLEVNTEKTMHMSNYQNIGQNQFNDIAFKNEAKFKYWERK